MAIRLLSAEFPKRQMKQFKTQELTKTKRQLLVFITPKILKGDSFAESAEKPIN
jgi:hypothetical protein